MRAVETKTSLTLGIKICVEKRNYVKDCFSNAEVLLLNTQTPNQTSQQHFVGQFDIFFLPIFPSEIFFSGQEFLRMLPILQPRLL